MSEYDERQYRRMFALLVLYERGSLSITRLADELETVYGALENKDAAWGNRLLNELGDIEEIYAAAFDDGRGQGKISEATHPELREIARQIKTLILEKTTEPEGDPLAIDD